MKDYVQDIPRMSISKETRKKIASEFILKYKITNGNKSKIIIYYADGKKAIHDYSQELEKTILITMKETFQKYFDIFHQCYHEHISQESLYDACMGAGACVAGIPLVQSLFSKVIEEPLPALPLVTIGTVTMSLSMLEKIKYMKRYQDFAKTLLYLQKEDNINFHLSNNLNFVNNTMSKKQHNYIVTKPDGSRGYTINSIDKMSLAELQRLLSSIEKENKWMELYPILYHDMISKSLEFEKKSSEDSKKLIKKNNQL